MRFVALVVFALVACGPTEPSSCAEAACDGETEMCVLFGSDTLAPSVARCGSIPLGCEEDRTCGCLDRSFVEGDQFRFCFDAGGCAVDDGVLELICPGG